MSAQIQVTPPLASGSRFGGHPLACHITYTRDTWVKLLLLPSVYAHDEAKLLCQGSQVTSWLAWVPNYGQMELDRGDFAIEHL